MADEQQEVRRINWNEALTVTHVFKSFRMARHFSKLALALAAVVLIWLWGWALDVVSGPVAGVYVRPGEIAEHVGMSPADFLKARKKAEAQRTAQIDQRWEEADGQRSSFQSFLNQHLAAADGTGGAFARAFSDKTTTGTQPKYKPLAAPEARKKDIEADGLGVIGDVAAIHDEEIARIEELIPAAEEAARAGVTKLKDADREAAEEKLDADVEAAWRALTRRKLEMSKVLRQLRGATVFEAFNDYEKLCLSNALYAVRHGNLTGNLKAYRGMLSRRVSLLEAPEPTHGLGGASPAPADDPPGFLFWVLLALHGVCWMICQHWLYAILFLGGALCVWALFGGAIHRIAALDFARDEKISLSQAMKFSAGKFLSFLTAPLIPLAIVLVIGAFMVLGGLLMSLPVLDLLMAALFPLAIVGGLLIAFLLIGLGGGGLLMYPTIAVESSDSFDAISRSYSYVFAKPWRAAFYGLAALVYGVICYLFVRLFAFLLLASTHAFVGAGVLGGGRALSPTADKLDVLWPAPTYDLLMPAWQTEPMTGWETVVAFVVRFWVFLIAALVVAFLWSYCASASTVIYFLLRRKVDATDLDDVYVEEPEEEPLTPEAEAPEEAPSPEGGESDDSDAAAEADEAAEGDEKKTPKRKRSKKKE